jgi:hypothetical protein
MSILKSFLATQSFSPKTIAIVALGFVTFGILGGIFH